MRDAIAELSEIVRRAARHAVKSGADGVEAVLSDGVELSAKVRLGEPELVHEAGSRSLHLRVVRDHRAAITYTSDLSPGALEKFVEESVELAKLAEPDELNELAPSDGWATSFPDLDLFDEKSLSVSAAQAIELARRGERAARAFSPKVTNSEGATWSRTAGAAAYAIEGKGLASGFLGSSRSTYQSLTVEPLCDDEGGKKRNGYYWTGGRFLDELEAPEAVGEEAARRTVAKLGAGKIATGALPVVFDPDAGRALLRALAGVISGGAIYRRSSYLVDREGTLIASPLVSIADDPLVPRAPGSRTFDGDGLPARKNVVVDGGVLKSYLLDLYSARKLGRAASNGCRGVGGSSHVTTSNFIFAAGATPKAKMLDGITRGLYVTDMMGFGFNATTGDFSRGASGFLIENGQLGRPVSEVTVSANFDALWKAIDRVGDDLDLRTSTACPTFRVAEMMVAGK